jgi:hypothetical protein
MVLRGLAPTIRTIAPAADAAIVVALHQDLAERGALPPDFSVGPYAEWSKDFEAVRSETDEIDIGDGLPMRPLPVADVYRTAIEMIDQYCVTTPLADSST